MERPAVWRTDVFSVEGKSQNFLYNPDKFTNVQIPAGLPGQAAPIANCFQVWFAYVQDN